MRLLDVRVVTPHGQDRRSLLLAAAAFGMFASFTGVAALGAASAASFSPDQRTLLNAIADTIIPDTDTVGASKAGVVEFIELILAEWMDPGQRASFLDGMAAFAARVRETSGAAFHRLPPAQRKSVLQGALVEAQAAQKAANHQGHAPFLVWMKRLTVHGYYTSEVGASQELILNMAAEYAACQSRAPGERSFSMDRRHIPFINDNEQVRIK